MEKTRRDVLKELYLKTLCPYLLDREEKYPCDKPKDHCNSDDCEIFKIVVDMGAY